MPGGLETSGTRVWHADTEQVQSSSQSMTTADVVACTEVLPS